MAKQEITEQDIRVRAYLLWEQHGKPDGSANRFWEHAEEELRQEAEKGGSKVAPIKGRRGSGSK